MRVNFYIQNNYTHTYKHKLLFWMQLIVAQP